MEMFCTITQWPYSVTNLQILTTVFNQFHKETRFEQFRGTGTHSSLNFTITNKFCTTDRNVDVLGFYSFAGWRDASKLALVLKETQHHTDQRGHCLTAGTCVLVGSAVAHTQLGVSYSMSSFLPGGTWGTRRNENEGGEISRGQMSTGSDKAVASGLVSWPGGNAPSQFAMFVHYFC